MCIAFQVQISKQNEDYTSNSKVFHDESLSPLDFSSSGVIDSDRLLLLLAVLLI